jgi:hypothetical protein
MPDGSEWDGKNLLDLVRNNTSPFGKIWDVSLLLQEVEIKLHGDVIDVPRVHTGTNNYVRASLPHATQRSLYSGANENPETRASILNFRRIVMF